MKGIAAFAFKLTATLALLGWASTKIDISGIQGRLSHMGLFGSLVVGVLIIVQTLLFGRRWWMISRYCGAALPWCDALRGTIISLFFSYTLPSNIGGDAARVWISTANGLPLKASLSGVLQDRVIGMVSLLIMIALSYPFWVTLIADHELRTLLSNVTLVGTVVLVSVVVGGRGVAAVLERHRYTLPFSVLARQLIGLLTSRTETIKILALSFCIHGLSLLMIIAIANYMDVAIHNMEWFVLVLPVLFVASLPISLAGWGLRESAMVIALGQVGVDAVDAMAISIIFGLSFLLAGIPGGLLWIVTSRKRADGIP